MPRPLRSTAAAVALAWLAALALQSGAQAKLVDADPLLPDLVPLPPMEILGPETTVSADGGLLNPVPVMVQGCFADEISRRQALRCLRFDSRVGNIGEGPLEIEYRAGEGERFWAIQRIYLADGETAERRATETDYHPTHAHFHIEGFYVARLWNLGRNGPDRSRPPVALGDKSGFCPEDSEPIEEGAERPENGYSCFSILEGDSLPTAFVGISPGWMDIYGAHLPDQYIEISDVPDGTYVLELEINPDKVIYEARTKNNRSCSVIELAGTTAKMVDPKVPCLNRK